MNNKLIRKVAFILTLVMIIGIGSTSFATVGNLGQDVVDALKGAANSIVSSTVEAIGEMFKDIKQSDWFASTVDKLINLGGISGYPDGTFKPNNQITRAEFTKILVSALGQKNLSPTTTHWASGYISKAVEMKLTSSDELKDLDRAITRKEMAKMASNALDYKGETQVSNRNEYKYQIKDFNKISTSYQDFVLKAYTKGIITGYTDGTFGGDKGLTRAEASTVILRVIDNTERKLPSTPVAFNESGPNVDLTKVPVSSMAKIEIYPVNHSKNADFSILFKTWEPLAIQYSDAEKILIARFGKDNSTAKQIMDYIKTKDVRAKELSLKTWYLNGQQINVSSYPNAQTIDLTVWRAE